MSLFSSSFCLNQVININIDEAFPKYTIAIWYACFTSDDYYNTILFFSPMGFINLWGLSCEIVF